MEHKTDRRSIYTQNAVKDAFLKLIKATPYDRISVTSICKEAEISRTTFYLHFSNVDDVLDRVIDDALLFSDSGSGSMIHMLDYFEAHPPCSVDEIRNNAKVLPPCQRIADSERYHALFMDSCVSDHIIQRIARHERDAAVPSIMQRGSLSEEDAEMLFRFVLHGTFAINRSLGWKMDDRWFRWQSLLSHFINAGIKAL